MPNLGRFLHFSAKKYPAEILSNSVGLRERIQKFVAKNTAAPQDQEAYLEHYKGLKARYEAATQRLKQIEDQRAERKQRRQKMLEFIRMLEHNDGLLTEFDEGLWNATVEKVTVLVEGSMIFGLKNEMELSVIC